MINKFSGEYSFLSNFFPCNIEVPLPTELYIVIVSSVEHAFQAAKTLDLNEKRLIIKASSPGKAKELGRNVTLRDDWEEIKLGIMRTYLKKKFAEGTSLAHQLLDTKDELLIEGNDWGDRFWGIYRGQGQNWLGFLLMGIRAELRGR